MPKRRAPVLALAVLAAAWATAAVARPRPAFTAPRGSILSGGPEAGISPPVDQPYVLGWSVRITPPLGPLETPREPGGVVIDPRTRWVYAGTGDGHAVCVVDGVEVWRTPLGGTVLAPPVIHRELLVVPTAEGVLFSLNKVTGEIVSRAILGEELVTQPRIVETLDKLIALVGSSAETLFAVNLEYGERLWRSHRDAPGGFSVRGFARPAVHDGTVYAGFADGWVQALELDTGSLVWERQVSPTGELVDVDAVATDGVRLYVASASGGVYALAPQGGAILWRTPLPGAARLALEGTMLYAGAPGTVQMLRSSDGRRGWQFSFGTAAPSDLRLVQGLVAFTELDGALYFLERRSGTPRGAFGPGDGFSSPPAVSGNLLFALSNAGRLYSMGVIP